jgi:hypothetical protein
VFRLVFTIGPKFRKYKLIFGRPLRILRNWHPAIVVVCVVGGVKLRKSPTFEWLFEIHALDVLLELVLLHLMSLPLAEGANSRLYLSQLFEYFSISLVDPLHLIFAVTYIEGASHRVRLEWHAH